MFGVLSRAVRSIVPELPDQKALPQTNGRLLHSNGLPTYTAALIIKTVLTLYKRRSLYEFDYRSGIRTAALSLVLIALFAGLGAYPSSALLQSQRNVPAPTGLHPRCGPK